MDGFITELLGFGPGTDATSMILDQVIIWPNLQYNDAAVLSHAILTTFDPSATPAKLLAWTTPSVLRASNSSHHPKRKSRAISLNHGVKELPISERQDDMSQRKSGLCIPWSSNIACSSPLSTYLWSRISFVFG